MWPAGYFRIDLTNTKAQYMASECTKYQVHLVGPTICVESSGQVRLLVLSILVFSHARWQPCGELENLSIEPDATECIGQKLLN